MASGARRTFYCRNFLVLLVCAVLLPLLNGCRSIKKNAVLPCNLASDEVAESRSDRVQIDHRLLGAPIDIEHKVAAGDVLGIYIADVLGNRDELPEVAYPNFRTRNAPIEPFVGHPVKVESDGTISLPYVSPLHVDGLSLPQVRERITQQYVQKNGLVKEGRSNVVVSLITPRFVRVYVVRQDTRYNLPGIIAPNQSEISRRWSGTTLYLDPKEASVLTALMQSGGLPGIDAKNEIWVMKGLPEEEIETSVIPMLAKFEGVQPMMIPRENTKLIRVPLTQRVGDGRSFDPKDVVLGDGDVVFLPRRDGDGFMTGGMLPSGRFPLPRDRDIDILEAIAMSTGPNFGTAASGARGILPPTDVIIIRRPTKDRQVKIYVDLKLCLEDPTYRVTIARGDLIILKFKPHEMAGNLALNVFNLNFTLSRVVGGGNGATIVQ